MKAFPDVEKGAFFASPKMRTVYSRPVQASVLILLLIVILFVLNGLDHAKTTGRGLLNHYKATFSKASGKYVQTGGKARRLYPEELMQRPLASDLTSMPKLLHQSWINETMPTKFEEWSDSCRMANPDWEWVLWTDEDNRKMVEKYAPWFMDTYEFLQTEIFRADAARNVYMHVFGGVYADLDTECLLPYDTMFEKYNTSTRGHEELQQINSAGIEDKQKHTSREATQSTDVAERKAFVGRMGVDNDSPDSIPNAWMASTPGHPFWLLPMEVAEYLAQLPDMQPEVVTGPVALYDQVIVYHEDFEGGRGDGGVRMDEHYADSGWRHLYKSTSLKATTRDPQSMVILPHYEVYPFSWQRDGAMFKEVCTSSDDTFDPERCKALMGLDHWGTHSITYWSHSWSGDGNGHWDEHMKAISKPNKQAEEKAASAKKGEEKKPQSESGGTKQKQGGDALAANKKAEEAKMKQEEEEKAKAGKQLAEKTSKGRRKRR